MLFVAITSPKKEKFLGRWMPEMAVPFCMGVGGSFDVVAGVAKRAPKPVQDKPKKPKKPRKPARAVIIDPFAEE